MADPALIFGLTKAMIPETPQTNSQNSSQATDPTDPRNKADTGADKTASAGRMANGFANSIEEMVERKLIELLMKIVEPGAFVGATGPVQAGPALITLLAQKVANLAISAAGGVLPPPPQPPSVESLPSADRATPPFPEEIKNDIVNEAVSRSNS